MTKRQIQPPIEQALRTYVRAHGETFRLTEITVGRVLVDLRRLCGARGWDFQAVNHLAARHYADEISS